MPNIRRLACGLLTAVAASPALLHANHNLLVEDAEQYVPADMPQQYHWRHGSAITGDLALKDGDTVRVETAGGSFFDYIDFSLDQTISWADDDVLLGHTWDSDTSVYMIGQRANGLALGLGLTFNHQDVGGTLDIEQDAYAIDLFAQYPLAYGFSITGFISYIHTELDGDEFSITDQNITVYGEIEDDSTDRYGIGLILAYQRQWQQLTLTGSTAIASMNARNGSELFDDEYASWNSLISLHHPLCDAIGATVYGALNHLIDSPELNRRDETVGALGVEFDYALSASTALRLGYEHDIGYSDYDGHRINLGLNISW